MCGRYRSQEDGMNFRKRRSERKEVKLGQEASAPRVQGLIRLQYMA